MLGEQFLVPIRSYKMLIEMFQYNYQNKHYHDPQYYKNLLPDL